MSILDDVLGELKQRKLAKVDIYPPFFLASIGCHLFNIYNSQTDVLVEGGKTLNTRLHICNVAPPGFCVDPKALVMMEDKSFKRLADVQVGDRLASIDGQPNVVVSKVKTRCSIIVRLPNDLIVSDTHLVLTQDGWKPAKDAKSCLLVYDSQNHMELRNVDIQPTVEMRTMDLIDIETTAQHFIANHIVVHNSKTLWLEQFLRGKHAVLNDTGIDIGFESTMTEAGFVGTIHMVDGVPVVTYGAAKLYENAIIGIEEFSAITSMMQSQHSQLLDSAMLGALDSGYVYKRLAGGDIRYQTHLTLWCGVQPARFDLSSGMGRRFLFLLFIPTAEDRKSIRVARRIAKNIKYDVGSTYAIRQKIRNLKVDISLIKRVEFDPNVYKLFDKYNIPHYEEALYEKLLLGYTIMSKPISETLYVELDEYAQWLVRQQITWRENIKRGSQFSEVVTILKEHGGEMSLDKLKAELLIFGLDWSMSSALLNELVRSRVIKIVGDKVILREGVVFEEHE